MRENHSESFWNSITEKSHLILGFLAFWSHSSWKRDYKKGFKKTKMHIFEAFCHQNPEIKMSKMQFSAKSPFCLSLFSRENYKTGCVLSFFWLFWASFSKNTKNGVVWDFSQFCLWFFSRENTALNFAENIQCILLSHVALQRSTSAEIENFQLCWLWRNSLNNPLLARECFYSGDKLRSAEKVWNCRFINPRFSELVSEEEL